MGIRVLAAPELAAALTASIHGTHVPSTASISEGRLRAAGDRARERGYFASGRYSGSLAAGWHSGLRAFGDKLSEPLTHNLMGIGGLRTHDKIVSDSSPDTFRKL